MIFSEQDVERAIAAYIACNDPLWPPDESVKAALDAAVSPELRALCEAAKRFRRGAGSLRALELAAINYRPSTVDRCGWCGRETETTEPRDYGYPPAPKITNT
jgi:hypothetical protein